MSPAEHLFSRPASSISYYGLSIILYGVLALQAYCVS